MKGKRMPKVKRGTFSLKASLRAACLIGIARRGIPIVENDKPEEALGRFFESRR